MIDIVCPSCQARYRLPDGSIGENGRRVSCSACGHAWLAHPEPEEEAPLTLGPEAIAEPETIKKPESGHGSEMGSRPKPQPLAGQGKTHNPYTAYDSDERLSGTSPYADDEDRGDAAYKAFAAQMEEDDDEDTASGGDWSGSAKPDGGGASGKTATASAPDAASDSGGSDTKTADAPESDAPAATAAAAGAGAGAAAAAAPDDRLADDRAKQMAQIRSMLSEIKQSPGSTLPPEEEDEDDEPPPPPRPSAIERSLQEVENEERDPLREKLDQYKRPGGKVADVKASRSKMMKKHAKKVRRRRIEEKRGSGTALTGFLLIVLVVSIMATIYLLHPLIIAKVPEAEPAIRDYVATMDQFRVWMGEKIEGLQAAIDSVLSDE